MSKFSAAVSFFKGSRTNRLAAGLIVLAVAVASYAISQTKAASFFTTSEPEQGQVSGSAVVVADAGASNGKAILFLAGTPGPSPTPSPTPSPSPSACPAYPAIPDENCTGWKHTGVTLHSCGTPDQFGEIRLATPNTTYDSCYFNDSVVIQAAGIIVKRSFIKGVAEYPTGSDFQGAQFIDVEIDSCTGTETADGKCLSAVGANVAAIGDNNYSCTRCNIHGGQRGATVGDHVLIQDSYLHGFVSLPEDHITGIGSNSGSHNTIDHNNISCDLNNDSSGYACSSGMSVYGDGGPNDDWTITHNLFNSGSSYCLDVIGPPGKPYPYTNVRVQNNTFGNVGAQYWHVPDSQCTQDGPINGWTTTGWAGANTNVWSGNVDIHGQPVNP